MINPFVFDRPNTITVENFINFYIKDHLYTRFLESTRNIILIGVRGSGKTSTLKYYSFPVQYVNSKKTNKFDIIGIYIPNKHPLLEKKEYLLYKENEKQNIVVEHFLCINIISSICDTFSDTYKHLEIDTELKNTILENLSYIFESTFIKSNTLFQSIKLFLNKESISSQKKLNNNNFESFIDFSFSFNNTVIPLLEQLKLIPKLSNSHFSLFFDDIQDLELSHKKIINSWISYRDNKLFSFKIATAEIKSSFITLNGGVILEGHDFIKIDLTRRIFNKSSEFSLFAKNVIRKRLDIVGIDVDVEKFLPISKPFSEGIQEAKQKAKILAHKKYPNPTGTQISDYVSKYGRAIYFREKHPKSNKPIYSGFETLVDISTGVIRNLLTPIFFMYEKQYSNKKHKKFTNIPENIQSEIIINRSDSFWEKIKNIDSEIDNCPKTLSEYIFNFYSQLMIYLKKRIKEENISEPRALNFIISSATDEEMIKINEILDISLKSTLLYKGMIGNKSTGVKIPLYIPNRLMLPAHGLDPHGQYSHFSITATAFLNAAYKNIEIPFFADEESEFNQLEIIF